VEAFGRVPHIYKKKDPSVYTNFRPISLIDVLSKMFETQIARHTTKHKIRNGYLTKEQYMDSVQNTLAPTWS
jgi:hypothetical protein